MSSVSPFPIPSPESTVEKLTRIADSPQLVFSTYVLILTPLALYVYHDILDTRWRPVWRLFRFLIAYTILYLTAGAGLIAYVVLQVYAKDYKEVGASFLAFILGTYGAWKLARLYRIIMAHRGLVHVLQRIDKALCRLTGLNPVGLEYNLWHTPRLRQKEKRVSRAKSIPESRHCYISSSIFDDDYPGEGAARIRWLSLSGKIVVLREDADECVSRIGLWMRLVLRRPRSEPWRLLTSTSPLVKGHLYRVSLGEALRSLISNGSEAAPPAHAESNPAQELLNNGDLTKVAIGFFWITSQMGAEEMSQVLAELPPAWMRGVSQNGKQLMFELVMSLLFCEMRTPEDPDLGWVLSLPVLDWKRDVSNLRVWSVMSDICADAVICVMPRYTHMGEMPSEEYIHDVIKRGVFHLQNASSDEHGFQGDIVGLSLIELIRAAYRSGYLAEQILGRELQLEMKRNDWTGQTKVLRIYKAEIVTGLFSILVQLGQDERESFKTNFEYSKKSWGVDPGIDDVMHALQERAQNEKRESYNLDMVASSRCWFLGDREKRCNDPASAFATLSATAAELAPFVLNMFNGYLEDRFQVHIDQKDGDPDKYREQWLQWKQDQALDVGGSTGSLPSDNRENDHGHGGELMLNMK